MESKRVSGLSIWGFVLSLISPIGLVSFVLALIDLNTKKEKKKQGLSIAALVISILKIIDVLWVVLVFGFLYYDLMM